MCACVCVSPMLQRELPSPRWAAKYVGQQPKKTMWWLKLSPLCEVRQWKSTICIHSLLSHHLNEYWTHNSNYYSCYGMLTSLKPPLNKFHHCLATVYTMNKYILVCLWILWPEKKNIKGVSLWDKIYLFVYTGLLCAIEYL